MWNGEAHKHSAVCLLPLLVISWIRAIALQAKKEICYDIVKLNWILLWRLLSGQRTVPYCHRFSDAKIQLKSPDMARTFLSVSSHRQHILLVSALFARNREPCARRKVQHHACLNIVLTLLVPRCKISRQEKKVSLQALSLKMKCGIHWINLHFSCPLGVVEHVVSHSKLVFINWFCWRL